MIQKVISPLLILAAVELFVAVHQERSHKNKRTALVREY
jgi:hypothetical protein